MRDSLSPITRAKVAGTICWCHNGAKGFLPPDSWFTNDDAHSVLITPCTFLYGAAFSPQTEMTGQSLTDPPNTRSYPTTWPLRILTISSNPLTSRVHSPHALLPVVLLFLSPIAAATGTHRPPRRSHRPASHRRGSWPLYSNIIRLQSYSYT